MIDPMLRTHCFRCRDERRMMITVRRALVGVVVTPDVPLEVADAICAWCGTVYERQPVVEECDLEPWPA